MLKKNDRDTIMSIASAQKVSSTEKTKDKKNYNAVSNRIINLLRTKEKPLTFNEVMKDLKDLLDQKNKQEFIHFISKSNMTKIKFDEKTETFQLKSKYVDMHSIEDLKDKIRLSEYGILEDEELTDAYPGIRSDLEKLKRENYVKLIYNDEKKVNVLFFRDSSDNIEKLLVDNDYKAAVAELRKVWKEDLTYYDGSEGTESFIKKRTRTDSGGKKKGERRRKIRNFANTHLPSLNTANL
jgi:hypothetical protein